MATTCRTADGDMLDSLCYHVYGHLLGCVEATLDAIPGWPMSSSHSAPAC